MTKRIALSGALAQKPRQAGHTWQFLQYLLGFRRLGWDVIFIDRLEPEMCFDEQFRPCDVYQSVSLRYFLDVMDRFDLNESFALIYNQGEHFFGLSRQQLLERTRNSAMLLNVMGYLTDAEIRDAAAKRVFLDTDPGFPQIWQALGLHDLFRGHDAYVTIAENIGKPECSIPTCGLSWITTPQPVLLEHWPAQPVVSSGFFTSVGAWRGPYGPLEYQGKTYGLRVHEFRRFFELPKRTGASFQIALDIHPAEVTDVDRLVSHGWELIDPQGVASDPGVYRSYIQSSRAEFMVAKNMYVQSQSGWFSERSMCYLASGKPVLAQDTGLSDLFSADAGLVTFSTLEGAREGVETILGDYPRHCRAAREFAVEHFDSDRVLGNLLGKLSIG